MSEKPRFFALPKEFRIWLRTNHAKERKLYVGFFKKHTGKLSITWPESVAEALCYGWIDGVRRRLDDDRYVIRFTPRRPGSIWSAVNIRLVAELEAAGKMTAAGRAAFARRAAAKSKVYSFEQNGNVAAKLERTYALQLQKSKIAWRFFEAQPPSYRKKVLWWVASAKTDAAKNRRFLRLLESCAAGKRLG